MIMTNTAVNHTYTTADTAKKVSLIDRFKAYMKENGAFIAAGMLAMQGDTSAWRMYQESQR